MDGFAFCSSGCYYQMVTATNYNPIHRSSSITSEILNCKISVTLICMYYNYLLQYLSR